MGDYIYYKAIETFNSNNRRILSVEKDDVLKTETSTKTSSQSKGYLVLYNERTKERGCVPGT